MNNLVECILRDVETAKIRYGGQVKTGLVRKIAGKSFTKLRTQTRERILSVCDELLAAGGWELRTIAFDFAFRLKDFIERDRIILYRWLADYVRDWGGCDDLCTHAFGLYLFQYPDYFKEVLTWTHSEQWWIRRASAVVQIYSIRRKRMLNEALAIADLLLHDEVELVRKGFGWMLKEIGAHDPAIVYGYVVARQAAMPRVALRYAVEKLDPELRRKALGRNQANRSK